MTQSLTENNERNEPFPKVYVVIVNYQTWNDTIECLESVLRNTYPNYQVVVVDNSENEEGFGFLCAWAEGSLSPWIPPTQSLRGLTIPPVGKPVSYVAYRKSKDGLTGYRANDVEQAQPGCDQAGKSDGSPVIFIHAGANLGFAGANNLAIRFALSRGDCDFVLLLNNDTVVRSDFIVRMEKAFEGKHEVGLVGGLIRLYNQPQDVWFAGGDFHWYREGVHRKKFAPTDSLVNSDFITGCLMMIPKYVIDKVGLFPEEYFLYGEDSDYCRMTLKAGYRNYASLQSVVYHKVSKSTGGNFSATMYYYYNRSRLLHHYRHFNRLDFVFFFVVFMIARVGRFLQFMVNGNADAQRSMIRAVKDFFKMGKGMRGTR